MDTQHNKIPIYDKPLPMRYNLYGEWRPLVNISGVPIDEIDKKVKSLTENYADERVKGIIKYIIATGFPVIEFIVKTKFQLPYPDVGIEHEGRHLHMRAIEVIGPDSNLQTNLQIYDGSLELLIDKDNIDVEKIVAGLELIDVFLHRLAFGADSKLEWFIKYHYESSEDGVKNIKIQEYELITQYIKEFKGEDNFILDAVVSWYLMAKRADNIFIKFLNYYIALEALALNLLTGDMVVSEKYKISKISKEEKGKIIENCITYLLKESNLSATSEKYIREAYGQCILANYKKTLKALELVFGVNDENVEIFKKKIKGNNLYDLRNKLAHGSFKILEQKDQEAVKDRINDLEILTKAFIIKVLHGLKPGEKYIKINPPFKLAIMMADPRSFGIATDLNMSINKDWRIKLEWLF